MKISEECLYFRLNDDDVWRHVKECPQLLFLSMMFVFITGPQHESPQDEDLNPTLNSHDFNDNHYIS